MVSVNIQRANGCEGLQWLVHTKCQLLRSNFREMMWEVSCPREPFGTITSLRGFSLREAVFQCDQ